MTIREKNIHSKDPATKGDLEDLREDLQGDIARMEERLMTNSAVTASRIKKENRAYLSQAEKRITESISMKLDKWGRVLFEKIDALIESRQIDLGAAKAEHVESLADKVQEIDGRVAAIERQGTL